MDSDSSSIGDRPVSQSKSTIEDPFSAFSDLTKPRIKSTDNVSKMCRRQRKEFEFAYQMEQGAYFSTSNDEEESDCDEDKEVFHGSASVQRRNPFWATTEDDYKDDGRWQLPTPPLSPDVVNNRDSAISNTSSVTTDGAVTPPTPSHTDLHLYRQATAFALANKAERRNRLRRRTCSSECLILEAVEDLRSILRDGETPCCDEFAIEDASGEDRIDNKLIFLQKGQDYFRNHVRIITPDE